ncbi:hypothetical protein GCM10027299_57510 [Larkinella ripae]
MNHLTPTREWPRLTLSRWQVIQLSVLSALIAGMFFWKAQYEHVRPRTNPVQVIMSQSGALNDQSFAKSTVSASHAFKSQF